MLFGHLTYTRVGEKSKTINLEEFPARIIGFAQTDMVEQFLNGIDKKYDKHLIRNAIHEIGTVCYDTIEKDRILSPDDKKRLHTKYSRRLSSIRKKLNDLSFDYQFAHHYWPVISIVSVLPKDELAIIAETLVNITSFKRRVSMSSETVGGPIDVAIISRGDGFVWIKKKHYFPMELNPGFRD